MGTIASLAIISFIPIVRVREEEIGAKGDVIKASSKKISIFRYLKGGWYKTGGIQKYGYNPSFKPKNTLVSSETLFGKTLFGKSKDELNESTASILQIKAKRLNEKLKQGTVTSEMRKEIQQLVSEGWVYDKKTNQVIV